MQDDKNGKSSVGLTPFLALAYGAYYTTDTWGARFDTQAYGALCVAAIALLTVTLLFREIRQGDATNRLHIWLVNRGNVIRVHWAAIVFAAGLIAYAWVQPIIGFLFASALTFGGALIFLKAGGPLRVAFLTCVLTALAWLTLQQALNVPLPVGPLGI